MFAFYVLTKKQLQKKTFANCQPIHGLNKAKTFTCYIRTDSTPVHTLKLGIILNIYLKLPNKKEVNN